jgi:hypothetical protein
MSLVRAAFGQAGGAPEARAQTIQPLQTVNFGSGTIGLPAGWQVLNSYQGCVEAGTQGGYLALGCPQTVIVPPGLPGADPRAVLMLPYADPVTTLGRFAQTPLPLGLGVRVTRIVEHAPVASNAPQGKAAYILFDYVVQNFPFRGLALIDIMPIDAGSYVLYKSMVLLSADTFNTMMPTLWAAWKSWSVNPAVFRQRMDAAIQSMRETSEIISSGYRDRQRSQPIYTRYSHRRGRALAPSRGHEFDDGQRGREGRSGPLSDRSHPGTPPALNGPYWGTSERASNDAGFNPNVDAGGGPNWQHMDPAH